VGKINNKAQHRGKELGENGTIDGRSRWWISRKKEKFAGVLMVKGKSLSTFRSVLHGLEEGGGTGLGFRGN